MLSALYDFIFTYDIENKFPRKYPIVPYSIVAFYVMFVTWIGPYLMSKRKPFKLQKTLVIYNFLQSFINAVVAYKERLGQGDPWQKKKTQLHTADPPEDDDPRLECGPDPWNFAAQIDWEGDDDGYPM
ncbi:elongation of very long chain fatty acids protein [Caerostris extrusa]|uniref:Elongation of very long chain fatty acids protein n=1 Tax=Caerostris extrusa TaxID=172846 RepID=A0AAV4UEQ8_CAEEX|nr:elongation of very long chain fatty acids protein [Caerostris extrusa]